MTDAKASPHPTILVVDDEFSIAETLVEILTWEGYRVLMAANGAQGLELAERQAPELILLDYMMPVMDGLEMLEKLRAQPWGAAIPVIFMTAAPMSIEPAKVLWNAFLHKPFDYDQLKHALATVRGPAR